MLWGIKKKETAHGQGTKSTAISRRNRKMAPEQRKWRTSPVARGKVGLSDCTVRRGARKQGLAGSRPSATRTPRSLKMALVSVRLLQQNDDALYNIRERKVHSAIGLDFFVWTVFSLCYTLYSIHGQRFPRFFFQIA